MKTHDRPNLGEWVSCEVTLPPMRESVLVLGKTYGAAIVHRYCLGASTGWAWSLGFGRHTKQTTFAYWMPLPPRPREATDAPKD